jgi:two-component sensor histidine kinase
MTEHIAVPTAEIYQLHTKPARGAEDASVLIAEANHRIANNLSAVIGLVRMEAAAIGAKETMTGSDVRILLEEIASRIDAVGVLHKMLAQQPLQEAVDIGDYLRRVCAPLTSSLFGGAQLGLVENFAADCLVSREKVVSLALIVNELVTNASKYAHPAGVPGKVSVTCQKDAKGNLVLDVADDGVGLPEDFDPQTDGNVGLRLVRILCSQMDAELVFDSSSLGLSVRMVLPLSDH